MTDQRIVLLGGLLQLQTAPVVANRRKTKNGPVCFVRRLLPFHRSVRFRQLRCTRNRAWLFNKTKLFYKLLSNAETMPGCFSNADTMPGFFNADTMSGRFMYADTIPAFYIARQKLKKVQSIQWPISGLNR